MCTFALHLYIIHSFLLSQIPYQFPQPILSVTQACKHTVGGGGGGGGGCIEEYSFVIIICVQTVGLGGLHAY